MCLQAAQAQQSSWRINPPRDTPTANPHLQHINRASAESFQLPTREESVQFPTHIPATARTAPQLAESFGERVEMAPLYEASSLMMGRACLRVARVKNRDLVHLGQGGHGYVAVHDRA